MTIRQIFCRHWFDARKYTVPQGMGPIICMEQKEYNVTYETRTCSKCGLQETRVTDTEFLGWT